MKAKVIVPMIGALLALSLSCSLFVPAARPTTPLQVPPSDADVPQAATQLPPVSSAPVPQPRGLAAHSGDKLNFYDRQGTQLFQKNLPTSAFLQPANVHLAGNYLEGLPGVPVIFYSIADEESLVLLNVNGPTQTLVKTQAFAGMTGVPGLPIFAYGTVDPQEYTRSFLFVGTLAALPTAPVLTRDDPGGWAVKPLAIKVENYQPVGIWYTTIPFGIGGDIVFEPRRGLYFLDLVSSQSTELLSQDYAPSTLAADRIWVAYTDTSAAPLTIYNFQTGDRFSFPLLSESETRGAGNARFSSASQYVAWMEGNGWMMTDTPSFTATVRIAGTDGKLLLDLPMDSFSEVSGLGAVTWTSPAGWLDDASLVVQVRGSQWDQAVLLLVSLPDGNVSYLAQGEFVGFLY
jgi:hypothetical protein